MLKHTIIILFSGFAACLFTLPQSSRSQVSSSTPNWHKNAFFGIHYDLHANADDTELGRELTPEHLRQRLLRTRPDWVQTDCKGHPGYTSWPTSVGSTSPGVVKDSLRIYRDVTRELGIRLGVHYSGVWDSRAVELHPEWARVDAAGQHDSRITCRLRGYDEQLMIPQMMEIIDKYDVDGFWVDGENWAALPCWCDRCRAEFTRRTGIREIPTKKGQAHWEEWLAFHRDLFVEHVTKYTNAVHTRKPGCLVVSAWMYTSREPDAVTAPIDYLSGDFSGAENAATEGRVMDSLDMSWDLMDWGFARAGKPFVFKPAVQIEQEVSEVVALGGAVMIYEQPQRSGWLTGWHNEIMAEVGEFCRARKEACLYSKTVPQAAVLHLREHYYAHNEPLFNSADAVEPVQGALQALLETHHSTDVLTEDAAGKRMNEYKLIVVPEETPLGDQAIRALEEFARSGGYVLISGEYLARDYPAFVGASPRGEALTARVYLPLGGRAVPVGLTWQPVAPEPGTEVVAYRLNEQEPARDVTDQAVVTKRVLGKGAVVAVHGPVFRNYFLGHSPALREFIGNLVDGLGIGWIALAEGPPDLEMILRQKDGNLLVNLINRGSGEAPSPNRVIVENLAPIENVMVHVRRDHQPKAVRVVPSDMKIDWSYGNGLVTINVPRVDIHRVLVIE
jgi:alpha-L-fucosidase